MKMRTNNDCHCIVAFHISFEFFHIKTKHLGSFLRLVTLRLEIFRKGHIACSDEQNNTGV